MRLFGGKIGFVGSGIHSLSSQILSKSFRNWFENRTLRGTKSCKSKDLWLFFFIPLISQIYTDLSFGVENICVICEICGTFLFISTITLETFILFHDSITSQLL